MGFLKIPVVLGLTAMLSACGTVNLIKTGTYQSGIDGVEPHKPSDPVELLHVDAANMQVRLQFNGKIVKTYSATLMPEDQWREGCHTNFTSETLETWQLQDVNDSQPTEVSLLAACMGDGVVIDAGTKTVLFGIPEKS